MNITFLIGNGFDLGMGLKSKFSDYFSQYIEQSQNQSASLKAFANNIESNKKEWSYFEKQLGIYTEKFSPETKSDFINQIKDFETRFMNYLKEEESLLSYKDTDAIRTMMIKGLTQYFSTDNLPEVSSRTISELYRKSHEGHRYNFISFNYTTVLENCLATIPDGVVNEKNTTNGKMKDKIGEIVHVHGLCDDHPIMGVDNADQIANPALASDPRFIRYIVKPENNTAHRTNRDSKCAQIIANSNVICIYGMSLGETDKKWWIKILNWLKNSPSRQLVIFDYDENYKTTNQFGRIEKEDAILDTFAAYWSGHNIESLRSRIHIAIHKNIFKMYLVDWINEVFKNHSRGA